MMILRRYFREVWTVDFEFHAPDGNRPQPLCLVAREVFSRRLVRRWFEGTASGDLPWSSAKDTLVVAYYASAEMGCYLALRWPFPARLLDLYSEFRCVTCGLEVPAGYGLLGAMAYFGLDGLAAAEKEDMRRLAMRGGPYTHHEREALLAYCQADTDALAELLPAMLPRLDLARALLRGRFMRAAACIEWNGIPIDTPLLQDLSDQWETIRTHLVRTMNRDFPVFVPTGVTIPDPSSQLGAAVLRLAQAQGLDPLHLMWAVEEVWRDMRDLYAESLQARKQARRLTGLTHDAISRWEQAGHDHASWPGLDTLANELAHTLPALGLGNAEVSRDAPDYAAHLWTLLRDNDDRLLAKYHPDILARALTLVAADPEGEAWTGALSFSAYSFERYLMRMGIPWPRHPSGALMLDDQTFRDMARSYPAAISPIREIREILSKLKMQSLTVGQDGRNRYLLSAFSSRTSRNQPSATKCIFGPSTWLRCLIKPEPGRALAYVDWSQQELAIAARLSGDPAMQEAYTSGDFYLTFAKMAGAAPPDATKETHAAVRDAFKVVSLGVLYGLSAPGLARRLNIAPCDARRLLQQHREVFHVFWQWSDAIEAQGMLVGVLSTVFGWTLHVGPESNPRTLRNFPAQANAAEMMRIACSLAIERSIQVDAVVHDALLVEGSLETIDAVVSETQAAMREASALVLPGFPLRSDVKIVRYPDRYTDVRGVQMWETIQGLLNERRADVPF
jgi:hypothetical protein